MPLTSQQVDPDIVSALHRVIAGRLLQPPDRPTQETPGHDRKRELRPAPDGPRRKPRGRDGDLQRAA